MCKALTLFCVYILHSTCFAKKVELDHEYVYSLLTVNEELEVLTVSQSMADRYNGQENCTLLNTKYRGLLHAL